MDEEQTTSAPELGEAAEPTIHAGDEPGKSIKMPADAPKENILKRVVYGYWHQKLWTIPATILLIGGLIVLIPTSRYPVLALFLKRSYTITVKDSVTGTPVSGATVTLLGSKKTTDARGMAVLTVAVGPTHAEVTKTYYKPFVRDVLVDVATVHNSADVSLVATGRQVSFKVVNKITGKPIPSAVLALGSTDARTDLSGQATIVVPASATQQVTVTADGYLNTPATLQVTNPPADANTFSLIPSGRLYFLSNLSGKLDVVSTNLDGSDRKTVLAGTGSEDKNNTVLLAARDWQYVALLSKRDGGDNPKLFLINTSNDKLTTIESTASYFTLAGWSGHNFAYLATFNGVNQWQPGQAIIKSYNADTNKTVTLASSSANGTSSVDATYESFSQVNFVGSNLVFAKTWYRAPGYLGVPGQQNTLVSVKPDGTGSRALKSLDANQYYVSNQVLSKPTELYFSVSDMSSSTQNYYRLDDNGNISQSSTITAEDVHQVYPTYLLSPSGKATFWSETRDGKNTLSTGDYVGGSSSQIASLSDYAPYGWFSDDYLLVQKNKSELYIMPAAGGTALKISDYFKPDYYIYGYGGGYGGI